MGGVAVLIVLAGLAGFYVFRSYKKMGTQGVANHYGLAPGEAVQYMWLGEVDVDISLAQRAATAAAGLVAGALLGGIGIATTRALGVTVLITTHRRLVLITEQVDGKVGQLYVDHPSQIAIQFLGPGQRRLQGGPSVRVQLVGTDGVPCDMILHHSAEPYIKQWLAGAA